MNKWRDEILSVSKILYSLLAPQIYCTVPEVSVKLVAFGEDSILSLDVNTVQIGIIRMIPQVTDEEI